MPRPINMAAAPRHVSAMPLFILFFSKKDRLTPEVESQQPQSATATPMHVYAVFSTHRCTVAYVASLLLLTASIIIFCRYSSSMSPFACITGAMRQSESVMNRRMFIRKPFLQGMTSIKGAMFLIP